MHHQNDRRGYGYEMDSYKQPLMQQPPLFVLMPANGNAMNCYAGGGGGGGDAMMAYGAGGMDTLARRRRQSYRDMEYADAYHRKKKGCCSCWRCAIAAIIILAILGVGAAIAGVVFIKLIDDDVVGPNVTRSSTTTRDPVSFDIDQLDGENMTDVFNATVVSVSAVNDTTVILPASNSSLLALEQPSVVVVTSNDSSPEFVVNAIGPAGVVLESPSTRNNITFQFDVAVGVRSNVTGASGVEVVVPPGVSAQVNISSATQPPVILAPVSIIAAVGQSSSTTNTPSSSAPASWSPSTRTSSSSSTFSPVEGSTRLGTFVNAPDILTAVTSPVTATTTTQPSTTQSPSTATIILPLVVATTRLPTAADIVVPSATGPGLGFSATMSVPMSNMNAFKNAAEATQIVMQQRELQNARKSADGELSMTTAAPSVIVNIIAPSESPISPPSGSTPSSSMDGRRWK